MTIINLRGNPSVASPNILPKPTYNKDMDDILNLYDQRRSAQGNLIQHMRTIRDHYNGDIAVPLPELERQEQIAIINFFNQGIDQHGARIASVMPNIIFPSTNPGQKKADDYADIRRKAALGWWDQNQMKLKLGRRARSLIAYSSAPVSIHPDSFLRIPKWRVRDPLGTYPSPTTDPDEMTVQDCIFDFTRSIKWLEQNYPGAFDLLRIPRDSDPDTAITCIEYMDNEQITLIAIGDRSGSHVVKGVRGRDSMPTMPGDWHGTESAVLLASVPNKAGICPVVVPGRVTLDRPMGQFDGLVGLFQMQSKLMALELNAIARDIFPDTWVVARANETPNIVQVADGLRGKPGLIEGADIKGINHTPGYQTFPAIDRLERAMRQEGEIPAEFGGESASNIRTGRRGDSIMSAVIDFPRQEAQEVFGKSLQHEIVRAVAVTKAYFGAEKKSFYVNWKGAKGPVDYVPNKHFDSDVVNVSYAYPGTDINNLTMGIGQRIGLGTLSKQSGAEMDPLIDDPELERDRIVAEALAEATLSGLQQQAAGGAIPLDDLAWIEEQVVTNRLELYKAVQEAQRRAQERQATSGAPGEPTGPVDPNSPEAQPGLANPGAGGEAGSEIGPNPDQVGLGKLMSVLRQPAMTVDAERIQEPA